jgi:hypothetical protein
MLDPRVREIIAAVRSDRMSVEDAAQSLLEVRRRTGCLSLMVTASTGPTERALVERYMALATAEFGTP